MSKLLEDKIKQIMSGKTITESKDVNLKDTKIGKEEEESTEKVKGSAKDDSEDNNKNDGEGKDTDDKDGDEDKETKSKYKDKAEVKEAAIPELGKDLSGKGKETSSSEDNSKILAGQGRKLGSKDSVKLDASTDSSDDNGDNTRGKLKPKAAGSESGNKLSSPTHEAIEALFNGEDLSEGFKEKAETIFEAAVAFAAESRISELQEEQKQSLIEAVEVVKGELVEQIDGYLDHVVEEWIKDNAVALESGIKVEMVSSFIDGMKNLFQEHYVEVPEDKLDVVEEQAAQIEEMQSELVALREEKENALTQSTVLRCNEIITSNAKGLTAIEEEKFQSLVENIEFETEEEFTLKVKTIRESYFNNSKDHTQVEKKTVIKEDTTYAMRDAVLKSMQSGQTKFVK